MQTFLITPPPIDSFSQTSVFNTKCNHIRFDYNMYSISVLTAPFRPYKYVDNLASKQPFHFQFHMNF